MLGNEHKPNGHPAHLDAEESLRAARERLPFRQLLQQHGCGPANGGNWGSFQCPFCSTSKRGGSKRTAGLFEHQGIILLKCHRTSCDANKAMDEVGFLARVSGWTRADAVKHYVQQAGVWKERAQFRPPPPEPGPKPQPDSVPAAEDVPPVPADVPPVTPDTEDVPPAMDEQEGCPEGETPPLEEPLAEDPARAEPPPPPVNREVLVLRAFYERLTLTDRDMAVLLEKRGLSPFTSVALGFASGRRENKEVILTLAQEFSSEDMQDSGLWRETGPNRQFHGWGITGKKPEEQRRRRDDKWEWGWTDPVIIPYFSVGGEVMKLRPHKGGAKANTAAGRQMIYVPRRAGRLAVERFRTVVICEGEFKAAAIWQQLGAGSGSKSPIGVCALPGITFSSNREMMAGLESWLADTGARAVVVAYDDEDKPDKPLKSRHATPTWAVVLERRLKDLGMTVRTAVLPRRWQVERKADWDGALRLLLASNEIKSH